MIFSFSGILEDTCVGWCFRDSNYGSCKCNDDCYMHDPECCTDFDLVCGKLRQPGQMCDTSAVIKIVPYKVCHHEKK